MSVNNKANAESQLQVAIGIILESLGDKSLTVIDSVNIYVIRLAKKHPNQVLNVCIQFCTKPTKPSNDHIERVLKLMESICREYIIGIDGDTILAVIEFALNVMIENVVEPEVQMPASEILVALGREHYMQVMDALLKNLKVGVVPHHMVPHTLGALANANAFGVVPYLKNILSIILPLLGNLKNDSLKQSFSYALGSFCEALTEYVSNAGQVPDPTITIENFNTETGMAFDVLFSSWLGSKDPHVVEEVLLALSSIYTVLCVEKVTQQTHRVIQALLHLYKKQIDTYNVTRCLGSVIQKAATVNGQLLEPLLTNVINALSDNVCISADYVQPDLYRSHSEVLRCYECFALHFTDHTIDHLIVQLKNNNEKERIKSLLVLTHLVSYSGETIHRRYKDILKQINEMLHDSNLKVKKALVKVIVAFSSKHVLLNKEINPEGPDKFLEFILKMCCKQMARNEVETKELYEIQKSAENTIYMLSTSVSELEANLWNLLMQCFLGAGYDDAIVIILRCLTHLASKKVAMESCEEAFIRCLALLSNPVPEFRGTFILNFLKNIKPCDIDAYKNVWDNKLMKLTKYFDQNYDNFVSEEWHDLLFDFVNILLDNVKNESFNEILIFAAKKQLNMYNNNKFGTNEALTRQGEKNFLLKCVAIILCYTKDQEKVLQTLDSLLVNVKLTDFSELHAYAEAVGICSRIHLQLVLNKLSTIRKDVLLKKTSKFFSFMKDQKSEIGIERLRYVVIYSYAEVCNEAPTDKLLKVIDAEILDFVRNELIQAKDFIIRKACLQAISRVADAMHPNRNVLHIRMNERDKVLELVSSQMHLHHGAEYIELFPLILPCITSLIRLPLPLESEARVKLIKLCFDNVYNSSAIYCKINPESIENYYGDLKMVPFITKSFTLLNQLIQELLMQSLSPATLDEVSTLLQSWLSKKKQEQRLPAIETLRLILQTYLDNMKFAYDCPSSFGQTGSLLASIVPRCTDPNKNIRKVAVECLCLVLCIAARYEGHMRDHDKHLSNSVQPIQQQIVSDEPKLLYNLIVDLAQIICVNIPQFQLYHFIDGLLDGLLDCESSSSSGSSVVLSMMMKNKGAELHSHVSPIMEKILAQINKVECPRTRASTLRAILNLATHHSKLVGSILLNQPLPFDSSICDCWAILSTDATLTLDLLDQLKKIIKQTPLYEEQSSDKEIRVATLPSFQAVCALQEILKNTQLKDICIQQFPELFAVLLVCLASYIGTSAPVLQNNGKKDKLGFVLNREAYKLYPAKVALDTFRLFLTCCEFNQMARSLLNYSDLDSSMFMEVIATLVQHVCSESPRSLSWMVASLGPFIRADLEPQRVAVVAFFTYLIKHRANDEHVLVENLLEMILDVQNDQSCAVRKIALQGLGYGVECLNPELISRHCNAILGVLMNSLDYHNVGNESSVILEGMLTFSKLLTTLEGYKFSSFQVTAAVRIKPLFGQEDSNLRRASFRLLGDLTQSLNPETNLEAFKEQIQGNLITLLLHLGDPDVYVVKACKYTLRKVGPYLDSPKVNSMIQEHLIDEANLHYDDFLRDLIKVMADDLQDLFPLLVMTTLSYFKSPWDEIRSKAALASGLLYSQLTQENIHRVPLDTVCDKLLRLLSDKSDLVRTSAVQAVTYLFLN